MRIDLKKIRHRILVALHLSPLSLAEKCRAAFGAAVILVLALALLVPYIWMGQLTKNAALDAGKAKSDVLLRCHFKTSPAGETALAALDDIGKVRDPNDIEMRWIRFTADGEKQLQQLSGKQRDLVKTLKNEEGRGDSIFWSKKKGVIQSNYIRIFKANDNCISCHNPQGSASAFSRDEPIGVVVIQKSASEISKAILLNIGCLIAAGLLASAGAIIAFYIITQRVILSPIRQLRALANNVAEGNLDIRSSIKTRDEYEKLSEAFNNMLDALQAAQEKLRQANKQLDEKIAELSGRNIELFKANKIKSEFLANMSHEFRTPLNAILGFAEILRERPGLLREEKGRRYAENIIASGQNLLKMINDLLDLAKSEAGKIELHTEKTFIPQLCKDVVGSFAALTRKKKIKVRMQVDENIPIIMTDAGKVRQILDNFMSNAVKFTPERGRIEIHSSMPDEKTVRISVTDTGCGIAEADKEKIFEKFRQADGSITRQSAGSGLGLAISKELAALLAASIGMESEVGKGSTFRLDIPAALPAEENRT